MSDVDVDATLSGDSGYEADFYALGFVLLDGDSGFTPTGPDASYALDSALAASSSFDIAGLDVVRGLMATLVGDSEVFAWESWRPAPGAPGRMPAMNAAATLQQFIDALGVGKSVTKTPTANSTVVDPHPPRKPFTPR